LIRVDFDPATLSGDRQAWWRAWQAKAKRAQEGVEETVKAGAPPAFRSEVWSELKRWLFKNVFASKCAYCEGKVEVHSFGDAEHWRPKSEVGWRRDGRLEQVQKDGVPHPGYWWLAYEWTNLLPACQRCNSGAGKQTQFPVRNQHIFEPGECGTVEELDQREEPLLLHPLRGPDPRDHIAFDEFGQVYPIEESELGTTSIEVLDLDRALLTEERRVEMQKAENAFALAFLVAMTDGGSLREKVDALCDGSAVYSSAIRHSYGHWRRRADDQLFAGADPE